MIELHAVRFAVFDFDGVFTDNRVWTNDVPADAWPEVVPLAGPVLTRPGGYGCVRELCDAVWAARKESG